LQSSDAANEKAIATVLSARGDLSYPTMMFRKWGFGLLRGMVSSFASIGIGCPCPTLAAGTSFTFHFFGRRCLGKNNAFANIVGTTALPITVATR